MAILSKKSLLLLLLIVLSLQSFGQFKLSGKIINYTGKEDLKINIPLIFGFDKQNSIAIPVAKDGTFGITLPIKQAKFANLIFQRKFHTLLLNQAKDLTVSLNERDSVFKLTAGTALPESKVVTAANIEEYPFFMDENGSKYSKFSLNQLQEQVVKPYLAQRDKKINKVMGSSIALKDRLLISTELKSIAYNYLNDLARTQSLNRAVVDSLIIEIFSQSNPKPDIFPAGPQYFAYIDNYMRFLETKAFAKIKADKIPSNQLIPYFGISLDSANVFVKKYSKAQWRFMGAVKNLPLNVVELYAYQQIINSFNDKDLKQTLDLSNSFKAQFPNSVYKLNIDNKIASLKKLLIQNELNANIKVFNGYEKTASIYDIIKTLKGKVVYLDVWGTWCGPCKEELRYIPALKARFKDKNVAFVYLDLDDEDKDFAWKEFIKVNSLTGVHLRKNRQTIAPFWKELLANATDKEEYYPQYFIFDKEGNLVVSKAKRPSNGEELYRQIENILN